MIFWEKFYPKFCEQGWQSKPFEVKLSIRKKNFSPLVNKKNVFLEDIIANCIEKGSYFLLPNRTIAKKFIAFIEIVFAWRILGQYTLAMRGQSDIFYLFFFQSKHCSVRVLQIVER